MKKYRLIKNIQFPPNKSIPIGAIFCNSNSYNNTFKAEGYDYYIVKSEMSEEYFEEIKEEPTPLIINENKSYTIIHESQTPLDGIRTGREILFSIDRKWVDMDMLLFAAFVLDDWNENKSMVSRVSGTKQLDIYGFYFSANILDEFKKYKNAH